MVVSLNDEITEVIEEIKETEETNKTEEVNTVTDTKETAASEEQKDFQNLLLKAKEKETKAVENNGTVYHFDKDGNILYTQKTDFLEKEAASKDINDYNFVKDAINKNNLNLDKFYELYHNQPQYKNNKDAYYNDVAKVITQTIANNLGIEATDKNGNYTNEIKSAFEQIYLNNEDAFQRSGRGFSNGISVESMSKALAIFSWDGNKNLKGEAIQSNDHINLSNIDLSGVKGDNSITTVYDYDESGQISSISQVLTEDKPIENFSPDQYKLLNKTTYSQLGLDDYIVNANTYDYTTNENTYSQMSKERLQEEQAFNKEYLQVKASAASVETQGEKTIYKDSESNIILSEKSGTFSKSSEWEKVSDNIKFVEFINKETGEKFSEPANFYKDGKHYIYLKDMDEYWCNKEYYTSQISEEGNIVLTSKESGETVKLSNEDIDNYNYDSKSGKYIKIESNSGSVVTLYSYGEDGTIIEKQGFSNIKDITSSNNICSINSALTKSYKYNEDGSLKVNYTHYPYGYSYESKDYSITLPKNEQELIKEFNTEINQIKNSSDTVKMTDVIGDASVVPKKERLDSKTYYSGIDLYDGFLYDSNNRIIAVDKNCKKQFIGVNYAANYKNTLISYNEDGRVSEIKTYNDNTPIYDENGNKIGEMENTPCVTVQNYTYEGNNIIIQESYLNGDKIGKEKVLSLELEDKDKIRYSSFDNYAGADISAYWFNSEMQTYMQNDKVAEKINNSVKQNENGDYEVSMYGFKLNEKQEPITDKNGDPILEYQTYTIPQTLISNIYTTKQYGSPHYPTDSLKATVFAYAVENCYLEPITNEKNRLHGKPAFNINYGPLRTGNTLKGFEKYKNVGYMLFGENFESAFGSTQQMEGEKTNCAKSKKETISFLQDTPVEELQNLAIQINPVYEEKGSNLGNWKKGSSHHGYPLMSVEAVYDEQGNEIDRLLNFGNSIILGERKVLLSEFAKKDYEYKGKDTEAIRNIYILNMLI